MPRIHKILLASFLLILSGSHLQAFEIDGSKWPTGEIEFYVGYRWNGREWHHLERGVYCSDR